ncbi:unnamed protein product [Cochlearia groenlandica]
MDLCMLQIKDTPIRNTIFSPEKSLSRKLRAVEIRSLIKHKFSLSGYRSLVVRATSKKKKKSDDDSSSSGKGIIILLKKNNPSNGGKSGDSAAPKSFSLNNDWREFRASLFMKEQKKKVEVEGDNPPGTISYESKPRGLKWAHPIPFPETGCVLVATEKLDSYRTFARTVVLLLREGTNHPQEGPFGIVINRPLHKNIKHMKSTKTELATTFSECSLYFGGPLEASMFLLKTRDKTKIPGHEEVMPGLNFGARNNLEEAAVLVKKGILKPHDFRFFIGYAGWQLDQLKEEIESDYWHVAACSSDLIHGGDSSENLWEEILQLMGGHYSELSRRPKLDM